MTSDMSATSQAPTSTLVLGGARSGKSAFAESLPRPGESPIYVATGQAFDAEFAERIRLHQDRRGAEWSTLEAPLELPQAIEAHARKGTVLVVDCLSVWIGNLMHHKRDISDASNALVEVLDSIESRVILVASEVGLGIVPDNAMAREFRDHAGRLNQRVAATVDVVYFVAAGLPLRLKPAASPAV